MEKEKKPIYCSICGNKITYREDGEGGCFTMNEEHGFCCDNPGCQVDGFSTLQLNKHICSSCGIECKRCDIIVECD